MSPEERTELRDLISQLRKETENVIQRIENLNKYENSGSIESDELEIALNISKYLEFHPKNTISQLRRYINDPEITQFKIKDFNVESIKSLFLQNLSELADINANVNDLEEKFEKFNLPKRDLDCESDEPYLNRVREFVEATWTKPALDSRGNGNKSLMEWMVKISEAPGDDWGETAWITKSVMFDIGVWISRLLLEYLWTITLFEEWDETSKRHLEIDTLIQCLSIGEESVLIECFREIVEFFHQILRSVKEDTMAGRAQKGKSVVEDENRLVKTESVLIQKDEELLHLIMIEILKFEVSFRSPDLPMIFERETYDFLEYYLRECVFRDTGCAIETKIQEMKAGLRYGCAAIPYEECLKLEVTRIWNELSYERTYCCN